MKIKFNRTPDQVQLVKAMASKNKSEALEAQEAFAALMSPVLGEVLQVAGTAPLIYKDDSYDEDDSPSYPLDLYYGQAEGAITVWSQQIGGGVPTAHVTGMQEMKFTDYTLDSAVSLGTQYVKKARLNVVAAALERMAQEVLIKQERNAWAVVLKMLANANTNSLQHVLRSQTAGVFQVDDLSKMLTLNRRLNVSFAGGTPSNYTFSGLTDIFVSPEIKEQIRAFAYNPMNTRVGKTTGTPAGGTDNAGIALPDSVREEIYRNAGAAEIFGVTFHELLELGKSKKYNTLFDAFAGATTYGGSAFDGAASEILVGIDASREAFIRPIATNNETNGTFQVYPDDQFVRRAARIGWYGALREARLGLDSRATTGLIV